MARCEQGYVCDVCGREVEGITESDLYLGYVLGEVPAEELPRRPERHIACNPERAQYIVDPAFAAVSCEGAFDKRSLDAAYVDAEEARVTRGWRRLQDIPSLGIPITDYPLG
jgi:hypothetical protein